VVEIMDDILAGGIKGHVHHGREPGHVRPDANHAREALAALEHLVVQDIFLTETAYLADVILPASAFAEKTGTFTNTDRLVQLGRQAIDPPGDARQDLWIIQEMAKRLGLDWNYGHVSAVFDEMRRLMPSIAGITWERLEREGAVTYPCRRGRSGPARRVHRGLPARRTAAGALRPGRHHPGRRASRRRVPDGADHRAASSSTGTPAA
jgi:formate dehydrogenase major subunit